MKLLETYVQELVDIELAISIKAASMAKATESADTRIAELENALRVEKEHRLGIAHPFLHAIGELGSDADVIKAQIIETWDGEKKTLKFAAGTLKFRTTQSLKIENETLVLTGLIDHTSIKDVATKYINGFNKTAVKKYMSVLDLPLGAAEIEKKTTVKLEKAEGDLL